jgi:hypothetical protein
MKTQIICPNRNLIEWKTLAEAIGEPRAYLSFFRNGNSIPSVARAKEILGIKQTAPAPERPLSKSKRPKAPVSKTAIHFLPAVVPKINAEHSTTHFERTRHTSKVLTEAR